jgi:YVTN family beta-propeller protein
MTAFDRIEARLPELMDELAPAHVPEYFDTMLGQSARTRQRPAWRAPERWLPVGVVPRTASVRQVPWRPIVLLAVVGLLAAGALVVLSGSRNRGLPARIQVGQAISPRWFAADDESLWVHEPTSMVRVDLATSAVTGTVPLVWMDYGYDASGAGAVWQTDYENDTVVRIDPDTETVAATIQLERNSAPEGVAVTAASVWVADEHGGSVTRIDPTTNRVIATIPGVGKVGSAGPQILTAGPHGVWVDIQNTSEVVRVDAATNKVGLRVPLEGWVASDGNEVWITVDSGPSSSQAMRIDPDTGKVLTTVDLGTQGVGGLAVGLGSVWASSNGSLIQIDEATGRVIGRFDIAGDGGNVVVAGGAVWVAADDKPYVVRIPPP